MSSRGGGQKFFTPCVYSSETFKFQIRCTWRKTKQGRFWRVGNQSTIKTTIWASKTNVVTLRMVAMSMKYTATATTTCLQYICSQRRRNNAENLIYTHTHTHTHTHKQTHRYHTNISNATRDVSANCNGPRIRKKIDLRSGVDLKAAAHFNFSLPHLFNRRRCDIVTMWWDGRETPDFLLYKNSFNSKVLLEYGLKKTCR